MSDPVTYGLRPVSDGEGGTRLEYGPLPAKKAVGKGKRTHQPEPFNAAPTADELRLFIERIERLDEEIRGIRDDRRDVLTEAKGQGYDTRQVLQIIKLRKMDPNDRAEAEAILETYMISLGLI